MTKVRVQDATKELNTNAGAVLENISRLRKQSQEMVNSLRKLSDGFAREQREREQQQAQEEMKKQYEAAAKFMSAYSSETAEQAVPSPEAPKTAAPEEAPKAAKQPAEEAKPAKEIAEKPAETAKPEVKKAEEAPKAEPVKAKAEAPRQENAKAEPVKAEAPKAEPAKAENAPQNAARAQAAQPQQRPAPNGVQRPAGANGAAPQRPYGRPVPGANQAGANGAAPQRPYGRPAGAPSGAPRPQQGAPRPYGGGAGGGYASKKMPDLTPSVEKERVSNYDPNKKQYVRQNDPERNANRTRAKQRDNGNFNINNMDDDFVRGKRKKKQAAPVVHIEPVHVDHAVMTAEMITVRDLSERIGRPASEIIKKLMMLGIIATINNELDFDTAQLVCSEFGVELELKVAETAEEALEKEDVEDSEDDLVTRPPVVTIMGHVDHGKTSLLDYIRKAHVTSVEAGGITQHIGAYTVNLDGQQITFLDTPGHEAFTAMRMRGAQATDIAVLVVAADDGVMPQTIEAINHAKAAGVQLIVAINKMDKLTADPDRIKQQLTEYSLVAEEWGGDTIMVPVSAHTGEGVEQLLEMILLVAEVQDYRANPNRKARGIIIEARLDKGRGPVATVLVKNGTLQIGDTIVAGTAYGRVRAMANDRGERVKSAGPSDPVEVIGFNDVPDAGDTISAVDDDRLSRQVAEERKDKLRAALIKSQQKTTLDDLFSQISAGQIKDLNVIIKADVQGSVEAVRQSLEKLSNDEVRVRSIHGGVGAITETDIMLASASNAIVIGFNVRPDNNAREVAEREKIDVRLYRVIYQAIEDVQQAMKGMLAPKFQETVLGRAQVRTTFRVSGVGTIAGSYVTDGKIARNAQIRLLRDNVVIHEGKISSLKRFKDDAREVNAGYECGVGMDGYNDIKEGDVFECFLMEEVEK